jgi:exocyst complex component 4
LSRCILKANSRLVPKVEFDDSQGPKPLLTSEPSPTSATYRPTRQTRFLNDLATRPNDPPHDLSDVGFRSNGQPSNVSSTALTNAVPLNPEADSFSYMETLIESLAVLGKLGNALDTVAQRLPSEIFTLVETTLDEVEERAEYGRRGSMYALNGAMGRSEGVYFFSSTDSSSVGQRNTIKGPTLNASCLRLAALESSTKRVDHEILKDLFWTLYSKLDAVAQGLRVVYEVTNRVGSVSLPPFFIIHREVTSLLLEAGFQRLLWNETRLSFSSSRIVAFGADGGQSCCYLSLMLISSVHRFVHSSMIILRTSNKVP